MSRTIQAGSARVNGRARAPPQIGARSARRPGGARVALEPATEPLSSLACRYDRCS